MDTKNFYSNYRKILNGKRRLSTKEEKEAFRNLFDKVVTEFCEVPKGSVYLLEPNRILYRCPGCGRTLNSLISDCMKNIGETKCRSCTNKEINKTYVKTCDECTKKDCKYYNRQKFNKYSKSRFCYTLYNLENPKLGWDKIWSDNHDTRESLLKHLSSHNKTTKILCKDCIKHDHCEFVNSNENYSSDAIHCYTETNFNNVYDKNILYDSYNSDEELKIGDKIVDYESLVKVPGVWSTWSGNICIDVFQTKNIGQEIRVFKNRLRSKFELYNDVTNMKWNKKYEVYRDKNIVLRLVKRDIESRIEREYIEICYACQYKATSWNPAPGQIRNTNL